MTDSYEKLFAGQLMTEMTPLMLSLSLGMYKSFFSTP